MDTEKDARILELLNELTKLLPGFTELKKPINNAEQLAGLAKAYADKGFRDYMKKIIVDTITGMADVTDMNNLYLQKGRLLTIKELFRMSETAFNDIQKLSKEPTLK